MISPAELSQYTLLVIDSVDQQPNTSGGRHKTGKLTVNWLVNLRRPKADRC